MKLPRYSPMEKAPRDGTVIIVQTNYGDVRARYACCKWLREGEAVSVTDCWRPVEPDNPFADGDIEFRDALRWRPDERGKCW